MLTYVIMCTVYCTMYLLTVDHRYIPWQCSVWMNGHISCYPRRRAGSEEVYVARQEEVREQEARQRLQHEEDELVRREIQIMAQAKTTFYLSLLLCPWSFWHRNSFGFFPFSRQQRLWMSSSLKNELFRHRRVRSLEMDIQYEDRVTAEIENFLREQLVMMCVIITLETWALLTELGARQRVKASATTKTFCTLVNFRLWFLQRISLVCIGLQGPST